MNKKLIIVFYKSLLEEEEGPRYYLWVKMNEINSGYHIYIPTAEPLNGVTWDLVGYNRRYYTDGIITDTDIKRIEVLQNTIIHDAEVFQMNSDKRNSIRQKRIYISNR